MPMYRVSLTRDVYRSQSCTALVRAASEDDAEAAVSETTFHDETLPWQDDGTKDEVAQGRGTVWQAELVSGAIEWGTPGVVMAEEDN
jgi:hypothetical protein